VTPFPQISEVGGKLLHSIMVVGSGHKLASWALWEFMPTSKCAHSLNLLYLLLKITVTGEQRRRRMPGR
jgi:hypothetical protein